MFYKSNLVISSIFLHCLQISYNSDLHIFYKDAIWIHKILIKKKIAPLFLTKLNMSSELYILYKICIRIYFIQCQLLIHRNSFYFVHSLVHFTIYCINAII